MSELFGWCVLLGLDASRVLGLWKGLLGRSILVCLVMGMIVGLGVDVVAGLVVVGVFMLVGSLGGVTAGFIVGLLLFFKVCCIY